MSDPSVRIITTKKGKSMSLNINETVARICEKAENILGRPLEGLEKSLMEYAVIQVQLGLLEE